MTAMTFNHSNKIGLVGEATSLDYLEKNGWKCIDVSKHRTFQKMDVDLVVEKDGCVFTVDVKTDTYDSGNLFIETVRNDTNGNPGVIYKTLADYWFYYVIKRNTIYVFKPKEMVEYIENTPLREVSHGTKIRGVEVYRSWGKLVPIKDAPLVQTINLEGF